QGTMVVRGRQLLHSKATWSGRLPPLALRSGGPLSGRSTSGVGLCRTALCQRARPADQMPRRLDTPTSRRTRRGLVNSGAEDGARWGATRRSAASLFRRQAYGRVKARCRTSNALHRKKNIVCVGVEVVLPEVTQRAKPTA